ncbi:MAG TPA: carboxypeptidase-like regulatory domain-containing protein [Pirellulaceae bacterium]|jgi:hypothetical protein|nr:carboxypeptidase-like regulatory domain-containing protein [Pirellulaceae bacterium]
MRGLAAAAFISAVLLATTVGCGPTLGSVSGTVTMDGQPVEGVQLDFEPVEGGAGATGFTDEQGNYGLMFPGRQEGAPPGEYFVRLTGAERDDAEPLKIPTKYNVESDLKRTVEAGSNDFDFEIVTK